MPPPVRPYYRRDARSGVTPPNPDATFTITEHITRARGKSSQLTSISHDLVAIQHFDGIDYDVGCAELQAAGHQLEAYEDLATQIREQIINGVKREKVLAVRAMSLLNHNLESLVRWTFTGAPAARNRRISWAGRMIAVYFTRK